MPAAAVCLTPRCGSGSRRTSTPWPHRRWLRRLLLHAAQGAHEETWPVVRKRGDILRLSLMAGRGCFVSMRRQALFALAGLILGASCSTVTTCDCIMPNPAVGEEFELAPLGAAAIKETNLLVRFDSVTSDSRCGTDVVCAWAG